MGIFIHRIIAIILRSASILCFDLDINIKQNKANCHIKRPNINNFYHPISNLKLKHKESKVPFIIAYYYWKAKLSIKKDLRPGEKRKFHRFYMRNIELMTSPKYQKTFKKYEFFVKYLQFVASYRRTIDYLMQLKSIQVNSDSCFLFQELRNVWNLFHDPKAYTITSEKWIDIGFQSDKPERDFRSSGELGILCISRLCKERKIDVKKMFGDSKKTSLSNCFFLVGIHMSIECLSIFESPKFNRLDFQWLDKLNGESGDTWDSVLLSCFLETYYAIFLDFFVFWNDNLDLEDKKMSYLAQYNKIYAKYQKKIRQEYFC
ncbi:MAG: ELMO domain-containing protein 2, variant 2 [Marteilia pararefringens]